LPDYNGQIFPDCGAGIGRVSKLLLLPFFESVDLLEQSPRLLAAAPQYIGEDAKRARFFPLGMQVSPSIALTLLYEHHHGSLPHPVFA